MGKHHGAGNHQLFQRHIIIFRQVGIHDLKGVIAFRVPSCDFINIYIFVVAFLPAGQDPVGPEQVRDAVLATAQNGRVAPHGNGQVVVKGIGATHEAAFIKQTL